MRWRIIRLIWIRELRDQLRDRRTLFTILALPLLLYPLMGVLMMQFATQLLDQNSSIGLVTANPEEKYFPSRPRLDARASVFPALAGLTLLPNGTATPLERCAGAIALGEAGRELFAYTPLIENDEIPTQFRQSPRKTPSIFPGGIHFHYRFLTPAEADAALDLKKVDLVVTAAGDFWDCLDRGGQPVFEIRGRPADDRSRRATEQFNILLGRWKAHLKQVRFHRHGLPSEFDDPVTVKNPLAPQSEEMLAATTLLDLLVRTFPFMLVMWSLAGALYPAVDLCAGEKERGTMETLLISPAGREEIVLGKFLTIWVFSAVTAGMHLVSMSVATWQLRSYLPQGAITVPALFWCTVLLLPLSAFFSAIALAVGAYARSSKEGQYYLMPLFWLTMPLVFLTLAPGVELNQFYSMVPVTGVALLMQRLMIASALEQVPWFYFLPVLATVILYSWLALRWAVAQFQREEVLFREAERLDIGLWLRRLFRGKEPLPTAGQALFCFALLFVLRWLSLNLGAGLPLLVRSVIIQFAFVAAPVLIMAVMLTTRPGKTLRLRPPQAGYVAAALLLLPLAEVAQFILLRFPALFELLSERRSYIAEAYRQLGGNIYENWLLYFLALTLLPALCEELAFRGLILTGVRRWLSAWPAILLSSFLFAAYHMNVFALAPLLLLGIVLGWFAQGSRSLVPGLVLHTGCRVLLLSTPGALASGQAADLPSPAALAALTGMAIIPTLAAVFLLWRLAGGKRLAFAKTGVPPATDAT